ncbi:MAG: hypothetical protein FWC94_05140 [Bacteroidales bacterium]|nr:hypothetical protein [Bacteroidales bacterium]
MPKKPYKFTEDTPMTVDEPALAYEVAPPKVSTSKKFNPNVPFHCTQEEFLEHIRSIEQGNFTPWEEAKKELEAWRKERLARYLK